MHKALIDMGYTDFECTPINKSVFFDVDKEVDNSMVCINITKIILRSHHFDNELTYFYAGFIATYQT